MSAPLITLSPHQRWNFCAVRALPGYPGRRAWIKMPGKPLDDGRRRQTEAAKEKRGGSRLDILVIDPSVSLDRVCSWSFRRFGPVFACETGGTAGDMYLVVHIRYTGVFHWFSTSCLVYLGSNDLDRDQRDLLRRCPPDRTPQPTISSQTRIMGWFCFRGTLHHNPSNRQDDIGNRNI